MPTGRAKAATREQVARYGHIAAALRAVLKQREWGRQDLNKAIGRGPNYSPSLVWLSGKGGVRLSMRPIVSKATGIPEEQLTPRKPGEPLPVTTGQPLALAGPQTPPGPPPARPVLMFAVLEDATIELEMRKIRLPLDEGSALLRLLLDAGVVLRKPA